MTVETKLFAPGREVAVDGQTGQESDSRIKSTLTVTSLSSMPPLGFSAAAVHDNYDTTHTPAPHHCVYRDNYIKPSLINF